MTTREQAVKHDKLIDRPPSPPAQFADSTLGNPAGYRNTMQKTTALIKLRPLFGIRINKPRSPPNTCKGCAAHLVFLDAKRVADRLAIADSGRKEKLNIHKQYIP